MTTIVLTAAILLACVPVSASVIVHVDDGIYDYPPLTSAAGDQVWAEGTTTVNLLTGGSIGRLLEAHDDSTVNVFGGWLWDDLHACDDSTVTVSGGFIQDLFVSGNSELNVTGARQE